MSRAQQVLEHIADCEATLRRCEVVELASRVFPEMRAAWTECAWAGRRRWITLEMRGPGGVHLELPATATPSEWADLLVETRRRGPVQPDCKVTAR